MTVKEKLCTNIALKFQARYVLDVVRIASLRGFLQISKTYVFEEIRIKQCLSNISFCPLRILYNSNFILMATSLGTNAVVVTRVHCNTSKYTRAISFRSYLKWISFCIFFFFFLLFQLTDLYFRCLQM